MSAGAAETYDMFTGLPVPGGLSERLWADSQTEVQQCLHHPFVAALAAGTLPRATFQHYVLQDAFFLSHYAKAYAAAFDKLEASTARPPDTSSSSSTITTNNKTSSSCSSDNIPGAACLSEDSAEGRAVLQSLVLGVHQELQLHSSYAAKWGVDVADEELQPSPATAAYCRFLMDVVEDPQTHVVEVLAAMIPCSRLYGYLGCTLAAATTGRHTYSDWLDTYSGAEYLQWPVMKEKLFDKLQHSVPYDRLKSLYCRAMQLEVDFFSAQPGTPSPRDIGLLVVDFDDTCTEKDTISVLLNAVVEANARRAAAACASGNSQQAAEHARQELSAQMKQLSANYIKKQQELLDRLLPPAGGSAAAAEAATAAAGVPYDGKGLRAFCEALSDFDVDMNQVVIDAGALKGVTAKDVAAAAATIQLRPGCSQTLAGAAAAGIPVSLLSVNWSTTLINTTMGFSQQQQAQAQQHAEVHANELEWGGDGSSTGQLQLQVQCGRDKLVALQDMVQRHQAAGAAGAVVYVGDSASDILPLLEADYGIIIGQNKLLRRVLTAYGVLTRPLCSAPLSHQQASSSSSSAAGPAADSAAAGAPVLYEASSWQEVAAFLFGPKDYSSGPDGGTNRSFSSLVQVTTDRAAAQGVYADPSSPAAAAAAAATAKLAQVAEAGSQHPVPPTVLTIAGSDCGGGAGIQADLKTIMANGGFGMSVITALTAQNSRGVQGVHLTPDDFLAKQLDSIFADLPPAAVKTGMLPNAAAVEVVAAKLKQYYPNRSEQPLLVIDPVLISTSGHALAGGGVGAALKEQLAPLATMLTPNITEAEALWGADRTITCVEDMEAAAKHLHSWGCDTVLIKGGHLAERLQQQDLTQQQPSNGVDGPVMQVVDVLYDGQRTHYFTAPYINTSNAHGTGCTLAAAIAGALAAGHTPVQAVAAAKGYLTATLAASSSLNLGHGPQHPFHHGLGLSSVTGLLNPVEVRAAVGQGLGKHKVNPVDLRVYVVTDPGCNTKTGRSLTQAVAGAVAGGATVVQLREKDIDGGDFLKEACAIVEFCRPKGIPVIINDRVDVALAADADGVHVGQSDLPARTVRQMIGPDKILGVSVKTPAEAAKAQADGADYIGVGAVFPTGTKASAVIGLDGLKAVCDLSGIPAVAIGGVGAGNAREVLQAGADGLAVVSAVFAAPDVAAATRQLWDAVQAGRQQVQQQGEDGGGSEIEVAAAAVGL